MTSLGAMRLVSVTYADLSCSYHFTDSYALWRYFSHSVRKLSDFTQHWIQMRSYFSKLHTSDLCERRRIMNRKEKRSLNNLHANNIEHGVNYSITKFWTNWPRCLIMRRITTCKLMQINVLLWNRDNNNLAEIYFRFGRLGEL